MTRKCYRHFCFVCKWWICVNQPSATRYEAVATVVSLFQSRISDLTDFERGQIFSSRLVGASVTTTANIIGVTRAAVSKVMTAYRMQGKTTSVKNNCAQKSKLSEIDLRMLHQVVSFAQKKAAELNQNLHILVSTKTEGNCTHKKYTAEC
ncbi:hypothetical protein AVEN_231380-1 [Araneus ventricosus]|uniref:Uncharacterized protein n=1 Tax=Araneus ventricosus TaxID=182803 RepID=A0A4Y2FEY5_ARAVE|nr:hypothetical protein AVEN_231380-1 [Araneus ventricosus]